MGATCQVDKNQGEEVHCNLFALGRNLLDQVNLSIGFSSGGAQGCRQNLECPPRRGH